MNKEPRLWKEEEWMEDCGEREIRTVINSNSSFQAQPFSVSKNGKYGENETRYIPNNDWMLAAPRGYEKWNNEAKKMYIPPIVILSISATDRGPREACRRVREAFLAKRV